MNHLLGLSGGKDSTALALRLQEVEPRPYRYFFTPTANEPPELGPHIAHLECILKAPIERITAGTLEGIIEAENILPSHRMRWCTRRLKIEPTIAYVAINSPAVLYVGLRADEDEREGIYGSEVVSDFPFRRWGWGIDDVLDYLHHRGVTVPAETNCEWCFDRRLAQWRKLWRDRPESFARAAQWEERTGHTFRSPARDTQPTKLVELGEKFASGYIPRGDTDQLTLFDAPETRMCRVCSL